MNLFNELNLVLIKLIKVHMFPRQEDTVDIMAKNMVLTLPHLLETCLSSVTGIFGHKKMLPLGGILFLHETPEWLC